MTKVLELAFLGRMRLLQEGQPLDGLVSAKAQALLCYLAVSGRSHSRQALAGLLWGELPESDARRNLRGVVMKLRQWVDDHLLISHQTITFNQEMDYWLDVTVVRQAHNQLDNPALLRQAVDVYRGEFLEDFYVNHAPAFEEWVMHQRATYRELVSHACFALGEYYTGQKAYDAGIDSIRRLLELDPIREDGHRLLMRLFALNGQRNMALTQYEACREQLQAELGVRPTAETAALYEQIRLGTITSRPTRPAIRPQSGQGTLTPPAAKVTADLPPFIAGPPITHPRHFFGRERTLKRLFNLLKSPPLQNAAIIGPRRSGKTSLLHYLKTITTIPAGQLRPQQQQAWLPHPERYQWVFVDFQDHRLGDQEGLLRYLLTEMEMAVPEPCDLDHFLETVSDNLTVPTVVMFDEIGVALQRYPTLDDAFWESLRSLATNQVNGLLAFILTAPEPPAQLADHSGFGSPFFNIFGYMATLGPLTETAAQALIAHAPLPFAAADVEWILAESGRWPILLQILCRECLLAVEEGEAADGVWREDALRQIAPFKGLMDDA